MVGKPDCDEEETVCKAEEQSREWGTDPGGRVLESVLGPPLLAVQPWSSRLPSQCFSFLIYNMRLLVLTQYGLYENLKCTRRIEAYNSEK